MKDAKKVSKIISIAGPGPKKKLDLDLKLATDKNKVEKKVSPIIEQQLDYTEKYLMSPQYRKRLKKQLNTEIQIGGGVPAPESPFMTKRFITDKDKNREIDRIVNQNIERIKSLRNKNINIGDFVVRAGAKAEYEKSTGKVHIPESRFGVKGEETIPVHEFSHAATDAERPYSYGFKSKFVDKILNPVWKSGNSYVQNPTELKARIDAIRFLAKKKGIYDPLTQDIDDKGIQKLLSDKEIVGDQNFKEISGQLKNEYKKNGLKWLLNNIAKIKSTNNNSNLA